MKYTEEEIETIAKSMYKAVRKALAAGYQSKSQKNTGLKSKKDAIADLEDPNYVAEAKESVPPIRVANMNKAQKGVHNPIAKDPKGGKSKLGVLNEMRNKAKNKGDVRREIYSEQEQAMESIKNSRYNKKNKPNLPKTEQNIVKSEKGIDKLKSFIKNRKK